VPARVVAAVAQHDEDALLVAGFFQMVEAGDDRVIKRRFPTRGKPLQRGAQLHPVFREINRARQPLTDIFVEDDRKHLVFGMT